MLNARPMPAKKYLTGIPKMTLEMGEYSRFSGLAARLTRGVDGYPLLTGFTPLEYGSSAK
jgi:hypothetical protein